MVMPKMHCVTREPCGTLDLLHTRTNLIRTQQCILCPNEGGAFKQTTNGDWVHLLCAIWVPETRVVNEVFMEPVSGAEKISKQRWRLVSVKPIELFRH